MRLLSLSIIKSLCNSYCLMYHYFLVNSGSKILGFFSGSIAAVLAAVAQNKDVLSHTLMCHGTLITQ